jgi:hypothetical protein
MPTFRENLPVPSSRRCKREYPVSTTFEDEIDRVFANVGIQNSDARESPKRKDTTFSTRRKFETK